VYEYLTGNNNNVGSTSIVSNNLTLVNSRGQKE